MLAVEAGKQFAVTGADLAAVEPTAFVSQNLAELEQIRFLAGTPAEALPLPDASFDAVVSQYGIEYSDLSRSIPEAVRVLAPGGRLRFAMHAAEGAVARDTVKAIADADFLLELDIVGLSDRSAAALDAFNAGLRAIADRAPSATDEAMLANVHRSLCDAYDHRRADLPATARHLHSEITAHRARQAALLAAARSSEQMAELGGTLETLGLTEISLRRSARWRRPHRPCHQGAARLGRQPLDLGQPVGDARVALLGADRDAVGMDELGRDADEAEHAAANRFRHARARCRSS